MIALLILNQSVVCGLPGSPGNGFFNDFDIPVNHGIQNIRIDTSFNRKGVRAEFNFYKVSAVDDPAAHFDETVFPVVLVDRIGELRAFTDGRIEHRVKTLLIIFYRASDNLRA
jgi:hypothetical protein